MCLEGIGLVFVAAFLLQDWMLGEWLPSPPVARRMQVRHALRSAFKEIFKDKVVVADVG